MQASRADGNIENGRVMSETCRGCHGIDGYKSAYPTYHVPKISGQYAAYVIAALKAYRDGERLHATMRAQAYSLSDQEMADIGAYLESLGLEDQR